MASKPNNWSGWSNARSLNANTEAVAKAIWDEISTKNSNAMAKEPNSLKHLRALKTRVNQNAKSNTPNKYYKLNAPKTGGFLSGLKGMFSSKTAAKPTVPNKNGNTFYNTKPNAFKVKPNAKPRRFSFFRRFGQRKTPPSAVTKNAVQQANTTVSVWNKLTSETSNTAQKANASLLAANNAAKKANEAAKKVAKQPGATPSQKVEANAKAYKAEKAAKLAKEQRNQAAKNAVEAAARLKEAQSNKTKTVEAAALNTAAKAEQNVKEGGQIAAAAAQLAQSINQGKINAQKAVALASANEGIKASVMNTNKKILEFIRNDWWPTTNGKFQNKNKKVWKARQNNKKNALRKNLEAKLKKINSSLTFNNVTAARVNKALENRQIGWRKFLRRYNNNKQQRKNWGLNLIRPKN
jgi:hypothetical protein